MTSRFAPKFEKMVQSGSHSQIRSPKHCVESKAEFRVTHNSFKASCFEAFTFCVVVARSPLLDI